MASGHVSRIKRPNTWQAEHMAAPTNTAKREKALAKPEPSTHGTKRSCLCFHRESAMRG
jgi:hypothetical protein